VLVEIAAMINHVSRLVLAVALTVVLAIIPASAATTAVVANHDSVTLAGPDAPR
jgi:hypothetical protein